MLQFLHQTTTDGREHLLSRLLTKLNSFWVAASYPFAGKGRNLSFHHASEISRLIAPHIELGNRVAIGKHSWFHTWVDPDVSHQVKIILEDDCRIAARCTITAKNLIRLERYVSIASDVLIMDHAHAYENIHQPIKDQGATPGGRIRIGAGCHVGQGAAILCDKGELVLGENCSVAPGAVVTRSFPPNSSIAGNPARLVERLDSVDKTDEVRVNVTSHDIDHSNGSSNGSSRTVGDLIGAGVEETVARQGIGDSGDLMPGEMSEDPVNWLSRTMTKLRTLWLVWTYPFIRFGKASWVHHSFRMQRSSARYVSISESVGLARDSRLEVATPLGIRRPIVVIEKGSGLQRRGVIRARNGITVMRDVIFGPAVLVTDHAGDSNKQNTSGGTIRIEEDCWIGFGAVIACDHGELVIGHHSVVGANTVVTRSVPPYSVVAGNPARIVKQYDFSKGKWVLGCVRPMDDASHASEPERDYSLAMK
jgi:acetyltransferase-like isoleucine patch superfamily enzyme